MLIGLCLASSKATLHRIRQVGPSGRLRHRRRLRRRRNDSLAAILLAQQAARAVAAAAVAPLAASSVLDNESGAVAPYNNEVT